MKIELELPEIEGFEYTGEYRIPLYGEYYQILREAQQNKGKTYNYNYPILRKKKPKYKTTTVDTGRELFRYVEIQALKDAMTIIKYMDSDPELRAVNCRKYKELQGL